MTSQIDHSPDKETCRKLISLGFARSNRVRLYGQEVQLISDPFPQEGGIAVECVAVRRQAGGVHRGSFRRPKVITKKNQGGHEPP